MTVKDYIWYGFGFPIKFAELPAIRVRGEIVPDVDFSKFSECIIRFICQDQIQAMSGNQVKFVRGFLGLSLRDFARLLNVKHQSVMRWEKNGKAPAKIDSHLEVVFRTLILRRLGCQDSSLKKVFDKFDVTHGYTSSTYKTLPIMAISESQIDAVLGVENNVVDWKLMRPKIWCSPTDKLRQKVTSVSLEFEYKNENEILNSSVVEESIYQVGPSYYSRNH